MDFLKRLFTFTPSNLIYLPGPIVVLYLAAFLGFSFGQTLLLLAALVVVEVLLVMMVNRVRFAWYFRFRHVINRLKKGDAASVIAELEAKRERGDRSYTTTLCLSAAYAYQGHGALAEPLAHEVMAIIQAQGLETKKRQPAVHKCDLARIALADAWVAQGRFSQAAHFLRPYASGAVQPNFITAIIAWFFYLAGDTYNASVALNFVKPESGKRTDNATRIGPQYGLMVALMRHKLNGEDQRAELHSLSDTLPFWDDSLARNAANPYGARLRVILDDLHTLLGDFA